MVVRYPKPQMTYEQQLAKLTGRGIACADDAAALDLLKTVGYYRISAYVYPFRDFLPDEQQVGVRYRSDTIQSGTTWDHVRDLWAFDRALRLLCLDDRDDRGGRQNADRVRARHAKRLWAHGD